MENNQTQKVGAGILTLCIIQLVFSGFGIIGTILAFSMKDQISAMGVAAIPTYTIIISLVATIIIVIGIIMILLKKELGVYIYFIAQVASIVYSIVISDVKAATFITLGISLIIPVLMGIFIWKKREVFGFEVKDETKSDMDIS